MTKMEVINEIIENAEMSHGIVAIRTQEEPFELGDIDHCSKVWVDGEETDEELDGLCCTNTKIKEAMMQHFDDYYYGEHCAIIVGEHWTYGEDWGEVIIKDPVCYAIIK